MKRTGLIAMMLIALPVFGQAPPATGVRPRIGLALEGGGAKGLAHIGVFAWLEEHHIPVDFIAGTSMGGLVGGLYAMGMRPEEMRSLVESLHWSELLASETPYRALAYRRKEDRRDYPNSMVVGLKNGVELASGLNSGSRVLLELDQLTLPYSRLKSFDDLPIPFRCVGTDLVSGRAQVFSSGPMGKALRSTMSLPAIFSPVRTNDRVVADGGLLDDLPVDVVKAMGADIVIAVHLDTGKVQPKEIRSMLEVAERSIAVTIDANELNSMLAADLVLRVDVSAYGTLDFAQAEKIIPKGYDAAKAKAAMLQKLSLNDTEWKGYRAAVEARRLNPQVTPRFIEVEGVSPARAREIQPSLAGFVDKPLEPAKLEGALTRLTGDGRIESAGYSIEQRGGEEGLLISVTPKDYAPPALYPAFEVDGSDLKDVQFTLGGRLTMLDTGGYRSEVRVDASVGGVYALRGEYYHPFTPDSHWFVAPHGYVSNTSFKLFSRADLLSDYRLNRAVGGLDVGYEFGRFSEVRLGHDDGYFSANLQVGAPKLGTLQGRTGVTSLQYHLDHLDDPVIPRQGVAVWTTLQWVDANPGAKNSYPVAETQLQFFRPVTKAGSLFLITDGGTIFDHRQQGFPEFSLGGPLRLASYGINELLTNQYFYFKTGYIHELVKLPAFMGKASYFTGAYEIGKVNGNEPSRLPNDVVAGVTVVTVLGPAFMGASWGDSGHHKAFFQLGKVF
jgi:NTE family protein